MVFRMIKLCFYFFSPFQGIKEVCHRSNKQKMDGGFNLSLKQDFETTERKSQSFGEGPDDTSLVDLGNGQPGLWPTGTARVQSRPWPPLHQPWQARLEPWPIWAEAAMGLAIAY